MKLVELFESIPIRPPSDDIIRVMHSNFLYGRTIGPKTVKIYTLSGGVDLSNSSERKRVDKLKELIPNGYISRLIVDTDGNVIEGQHRLEALRELGINDVPVYVIEDLAKDIDIIKLENIAQESQPIHSDQVNQLIRNIMELIVEEGSASKVLDEYEPPRGFEKAWNAIFKELCT